MADVLISNEGTIWLFTLESDEARAWAESFVDVPRYMREPSGFAADWRMGRDIADGMAADGLVVREEVS
jgi:hypothetical protein